jgi:hypothetical protein
MKKGQPQWHWEDGTVDEDMEHIELRHGDTAKIPYANWWPIARIGKPRHRRFPVQWLVTADTVENQAVVADARRELDFYLIEKEEPRSVGLCTVSLRYRSEHVLPCTLVLLPKREERGAGVKHGRATPRRGSGRTVWETGDGEQLEET